MLLTCQHPLELRSFQEHMSDDLFALVERNREHLQKWLMWVPHTKSPKDSLLFLQGAQQFVKEKQAFRGGIFWNGDLVGAIGFHEFHKQDRCASIGYWLSKDMTGKGIVTNAVKRIVQHGFEDLSLHRLELRAATENIKSWKIAERVGFQREGCIRECSFVHGRYLSHYVYGMLKEDFLKQVP